MSPPPPPPPPPSPPPSNSNSTPQHLLDLSPSDHLSEHRALPPQQAEGKESDGYPDRSTYQALPDTPPPGRATEITAENVLAPIEADPNAEDDYDDPESILYDLEAIRGQYKRSSVAPHPGFVRRDIGLARRNNTPKPLSPVLSLVGGEVRREKGATSTTATATASATNTTTTTSTTPAAANNNKLHHRTTSSTRSIPRHSDPRDTLTPSANLSSPPDPTTTAAIPNLPGKDEADRDRATNDPEQQSGAAEEEEEEEDSESISDDSSISSASMEEEESWISSFCNVIGHEYFAEVSEDFIEDDFNLTGLGAVVPMYKEALEMILDVEPEDDSESPGSASESLSENPTGTSYRRQRGHARTASDYSMIETSAELLYGLIHQRFITSRQGIQVMYEKYLANHFGFCPRVNCNSARVLPCGYSDTPGTETVKLFCPSCCDIYVPPNSRFQTVDGAYFGTTFPTLFLMTFPELDISGTGRKDVTASSTLNSSGGRKGAANNILPPINGVPANNIAPGLGKGKRYEMRIYGFRVNERARSGPRMGWLRDKPEDLEELNEMARAAAEAEEIGSEEEDEGDDEEDDEDEEEEEDEEMAFPDGGKPRRKREKPVTSAAAASEMGNGGDSVR